MLERRVRARRRSLRPGRTAAAGLAATALLVGPAGTIMPGSAGGTRPDYAVAATTTVLPKPGTDAAPNYPCRGYSSLPVTNPLAQVRRDAFAWGGYAPVRVGNGAGDIGWRANPYRHVSWYMWLHSLRWIGTLVVSGERGNAADLAHATAIVRDWVRDNPTSWKRNPAAWESTMHRTNVLLCLRGALSRRAGGTLPAEHAWLDRALVDHAEFMRANFSGWNNHGTDESLAIVGVGCTLRRPAYMTLGAGRLSEALHRTIDPQGATNEQSTGYASFNHALWGGVERALRQCTGTTPVVADIASRRARLTEFLAHATASDGLPHQIGNTQLVPYSPIAGSVQEWAVTRGAKAAPPRNRGAIYRAGYVFGRSGWGTGNRPFTTESAYSLRFGPGRAHHGHADHTSLTWQTRGRTILRDTGYGEYTKDAWEAYSRSPEAHSQLVVPGMSHAAATTLVRSSFGRNPALMGDSFTLRDSPAPGVTRTRDVIVLTAPDVVLVVDRASSRRGTTFRQLWQLPAGQNVTVSRDGRSLSTQAGSTRTTMIQVPLRGAPVPRGSVGVQVGSSRPIAGWHWPTMFRKGPAPTVSMVRSGRSATVATAIVAARPGARVAVTPATGRRGAQVVTVVVDGVTAQVAVSPTGVLTRVR